MLDILFVQNYYERTFGIMQISALLKQHGFTTDIAIGTKESVVEQAIEKKPRVLGFYCTTGFHYKAIAIASEVKRKLGHQILTICGGPHPTFVPSMIEAEGIDIICRGEGEYAVLELLQALLAGQDYNNIKNLTVKKDGHIYENEIRELCDIDALPFPDREIYQNIEYIYRQVRQEVMVARGCPFDCSFCSNHAYRELYKGKGPYVRFRSISNVIKEMEEIKKRYHPSCFFFNDDTFILKKDYCFEFLDSYKTKIDLPFACLIRADLATDSLIKLFKESGCYLTSFGIESGDETLRNKILNKRLLDKDILNCAALLHKYKIPFATFNMVGLPVETLSQVWQTVNLNTLVKSDWAWFSIYQTLPKTQLAQYALDLGCLDKINVVEADANFHESGIILRNNPDGKKIIRLKNCANLIVRFPFLKTMIDKVALNLPLNKVYGLLDKFLYFIFYYSKLTYKQGLLKTLRSALFMLSHLKEFK
jgi:anaerobic magnesium-protoporphyrin IX monomethyl ester cyclase